MFLHNTLWHMSLTEKNVRIFLPLPFTQETSFFSAFLHGFNNGSKHSSVVGGATVCAQKKLPCTVRFTLDRLMKTEVKRLLNGLRTDIERTTHGRGTDRARSVPFYVCTYYARVTIKFYACTTQVFGADFE